MEFADSADERRGMLAESVLGARLGASEMMYLTEGPGGLPMLWTMTITAPAQPVELVGQVVVVVAGIGQGQDFVEGGNPAVDWSS